MKFLCDNCKAKYQIADDKVAGKTVRMKCRKCGHLIEIRASVTETSVATGVPPEAVISERPPPASPARPSAPKPSAPSAGAKKPVAPSASTPRPSAAAARPAPSAGTTKPSAGLAPRPAGGGGLASAFSKAVTDEKQPRVEDPSTTRALDMSSPASTEEWYVGINGVPVGPIRVAELRAKAATGAITEDSLVWREGFEEWVPLRTFSELVALLRPDRPSYAPAPAPASAARGPSLSNPSQPTSARPGSQRPPSRSNVIPFHGRAATAEKLEEAPSASAEAAIEDPFAAPRPLAAVPPPAEPPSSGEVAAPFMVAPAPAIPSELVERPRPAGGIPPAAWFAIVAAMATGVVGGWALFSSKAPPPPTVQIVTVTAPAPTAPAPTASAGGGDTAEVIEVRPDPSSTVAKAGTPKVGGTVPTAAAAEKPTAEPATPQVPGIGGVGALPTVGGPSGPSGPGGPSTSGTPDQLSSADIQKVVNNGRNALKRACWEPALAAKSSNAPSSARVQVAITIGRDGRVSRASPSGGDAFPTLGSCIAGRVRNWVFPAANSETQTTAVFNFVAQLPAARRRSLFVTRPVAPRAFVTPLASDDTA